MSVARRYVATYEIALNTFWNHGSGAVSLGTAMGVEAIGEFKTLVDTYSAQFGGNGAVINATTKSGTNSLQGTVYGFLRNDAMDARNFNDGSTKPELRKNQLGGSLGDPIKKDKVFFANYEGLRRTRVALLPAELRRLVCRFRQLRFRSRSRIRGRCRAKFNLV